MMNIAIQILLGLLCVPLLIAGGTAMFNPLAMVERFAVEPIGTDGLAAIRGTYAGFLLGLVAMIGLGLLRRHTFWFLSAAVMIGMVLLGRIFGLVFDGVGPDAARHVGLEALLIALLIIAHKRLAPANATATQP